MGLGNIPVLGSRDGKKKAWYGHLSRLTEIFRAEDQDGRLEALSM